MNEELVFNPTRLDVSRSGFNVKRPEKGTGYVGRLNTMRPIEVLPGASYVLDLASLIRFTTPVFPINDDLYCDVYAYYCSDDMLLRRQSFSPSLNDGNHSFAAVMGAQDGFINMPYPDNSLQLPVIKYPMLKYNPDPAQTTQTESARKHVNAFSMLDQLGYPMLIRDSSVTGISYKTVDSFHCLPMLGYLAIWNEDFREPNLMNRYAMTISNDVATFASDLTTMCVGTGAYNSDGNNYGVSGKPIRYNPASGSTDILSYAINLPVCRFHGLYGSLLPFPQRNSEAVTLPLGDLAPVYANYDDEINPKPDIGWNPLVLGQINGDDLIYSDGNLGIGNGAYLQTDGQGSGSLGSQPFSVSPANLVADLKNATAASINTIRTAFQLQKWYEALARGGNGDLDEYINSIFGVVGPTDVVAKRPVYLGGKRFPISISQVNNTASNTGETGAFSLTNDYAQHIVKLHSKTYGQIFFVFCIRFADTFADAPQKFLFKRSKFDFYAPQFANLGEEEYKKYMLAYSPDVTGSLGYQEYAADYRYDFGAISGQMRFPGENSWHFGNLFEAGKMDLLSWLDASYQALAVDRTLKVPGSTALYHFFYDFLILGNKYLPMPVNSIPGLVDHH